MVRDRMRRVDSMGQRTPRGDRAKAIPVEATPQIFW